MATAHSSSVYLASKIEGMMSKIGCNAKKIALIIVACVVLGAMLALAIAGIVYGVRGNVERPTEAYMAEIERDTFTNNADIRVMSSNLLVHYASWGGTPVKVRGGRYLAMIESYKPDVIGVQEMSEEWFAVLNQKLPANYRVLDSGATFFDILLTGMIYNSDTLELLEHGNFAYKEGENVRLRRIVWAKFRHKKTGKIFATTSTHLSLLFGGKEEEFKGVMDSQAEEIVEFAKILAHDCPVISVGDYNTRDDAYVEEPRSDDYPAILHYMRAHMRDAKNEALHKVAGMASPYNTPLYDHIFYLGDIRVDTFAILSHEYLSELSDHYPIFADIAL